MEQIIERLGRLPKRMVQTVVVAKGEENRITRLCGCEGR